MAKAVKPCPIKPVNSTTGPNKPVPPPLPPKKPVNKKPHTEISVTCSHGRTKNYPFNGLYEIVPTLPPPDPSGKPPTSTLYSDKVVISWTSSAPDPVPPDKLDVVAPGNAHTDYNGPGTYNLDLSIDPKEFQKATGKLGWFKNLIAKAHTYPHKKTYALNSLPGWTDSSEVVIYNPQIWKLRIGIPDLTKIDSSFGGTYETGSALEGNEVAALTTPQATKAIGYASTSTSLASKAVEMIVNGAKLESKALETLSYVLTAANAVMEIINGIASNVPQVGWYFSMDYAFFTGDVGFEWGWKEYKDHRAYYYFKADGKLTVFSLALEVGAGASAFVAKVQVFAKGQGDVVWSPSIEHNQPGKKFDIVLPFAGTISFCVGARFEVLTLVKIEATINTGLTITGTLIFSPDVPLKKTLDVNFNGVYAEVTIGIGPVGAFAVKAYRYAKAKKDPVTGKKTVAKLEQNEWKGTINIINARTLGHWEWPNEQLAAPDRLAPATLRRYFEKMLNGSYTSQNSLTFRSKTESKSTYTLLNTEVIPNTDVATKLQEAATAWAEENEVYFQTQEPDGTTALAGFLMAVRKELDAKQVDTSKVLSKYIEGDKLDEYVENGFKAKLTANLAGIATLKAIAAAPTP